MVAPLSPNHVFDFLMDEPHDFDDSDLEFEDEPEEEPEAENEEEFEEDPEEEEEELEWEDDIPPIDAPHIELSPTSPPPKTFDGETVSLKRLLLRTFPMTCTLCLEVSPPVTFSLLSDFEGVTDCIMVAPLSPNHVFDFLADEPHDFDDSDLEFEEEPEEENEEEFEEDPKEDPE
ncbi:hypothetical protein Tco_0572333 [Tanacetum coccineum]